MREIRNPFRLQAAEQIDSDANFLKLFGPGVLDLLPEETPFARPHFIRSAPGGGKTSLLKLFTPSVLQTLIALHANEEYRELFQRLAELGVVDEQEARIVGVMLPCARTFPDLADLGLPAARAKRLLMALLDARIMLGALRSAVAVRRLRYPEDLQRLRIRPSAGDTGIPGLAPGCDGREARAWAESVERSICDVIDSLVQSDSTALPGHEALLMLRLMDQGAIQIDDTPVGSRWLVLLDDVHRLTSDQRSVLRETLVEERSRTTVWVAERLEALPQDELLGSGALSGRDYGVINLEEAWRRAPSKRSFESAVSAIAKRRARMAAEVAVSDSIGSFETIVNASLDEPERLKPTLDALETVTKRVRATHQTRYAAWIAAHDELKGTPRERLIAWRALEILIERHRRKSQQAFDFALSRDDMADTDYKARAAAELFLAKEHGFPYYFGGARLANLGSYNVEQYLQLAGDLFEEALARSVLRKPPTLSPERQQQLLIDASAARLKDLPRRAKNGRDVLAFLEAVGTFCREITYQPNAPYAPGVTGVAISMQEREQLLNKGALAEHAGIARFAQMLATAVAQNLIHVELDRSAKNQQWMILYLNRIVCAKHGLPPNFGGWREQRLKDLVTWMERGYRPSRTESLPL